jgi:hypothetical protein
MSHMQCLSLRAAHLCRRMLSRSHGVVTEENMRSGDNGLGQSAKRQNNVGGIPGLVQPRHHVSRCRPQIFLVLHNI